MISTAVPAGTKSNNSIRSALRIRMQPCEPGAPSCAESAAGQPQDARLYPVAFWKLRAQFRRVDFAGRAAAHEHGVFRLSRTDLGADDVFAARRAIAAACFARAVRGGGNSVAAQQLARVIEQFEPLRGDVYVDFHCAFCCARRIAKKLLSMAPHSSASTPPVTSA